MLFQEHTMPTITCIEDLRQWRKRACRACSTTNADAGLVHRRHLPRQRSDFRRIQFRQRVAVNLENRSTSAPLLGQDYRMPVDPPTGLTGMQHADGDMLAARAAKAFGMPFTLSTMSICSIEDMAEATGGHPFWFQLYVMRDRDFMVRLIDRARAANCSALVLTLDLQVLGQRHKDIKNGLSTPPKPTLANLINLANQAALVPGHAGYHSHTLPQHRRPRQQCERCQLAVVLDAAAQLYPSSAGAMWPRSSVWGCKLIVKGDHRAEDAPPGGATAVPMSLVVSNHGGRQLDGAPSSIQALPTL